MVFTLSPNASFMNAIYWRHKYHLLGIRMPKNITSYNSLCTSIYKIIPKGQIWWSYLRFTINFTFVIYFKTLINLLICHYSRFENFIKLWQTFNRRTFFSHISYSYLMLHRNFHIITILSIFLCNSVINRCSLNKAQQTFVDLKR